MSTITISEDQLAVLIKKQILAQTGSQSVKSLKKDQPSICIKTKEQLAETFKAAGHELTTNFISEYSELRSDKREGKENNTVGGYGFVSSSEKLSYNQKPKVWMKVSGLMGLVTLDGIQANVGKLESEEKNLQAALEVVRDLKAGFTAVYRQMTEQEVK